MESSALRYYLGSGALEAYYQGARHCNYAEYVIRNGEEGSWAGWLDGRKLSAHYDAPKVMSHFEQTDNQLEKWAPGELGGWGAVVVPTSPPRPLGPEVFDPIPE
ncbi:hypothetical protein N7445_010063 [Penicillium cf. griseofulvum]|nr:hypothetical protein N7445_010063 [Penicillium cf. griseofulvum]